MVVLKYVADLFFWKLTGFSLVYLATAIPQFSVMFYLILAAFAIGFGTTAKTNKRNKSIVGLAGLVFGTVTAFSMLWG